MRRPIAGLAYVVFERLPLGDFGNRIPQLQFEVIRPVGGLRARRSARSALIPGATEYRLRTDHRDARDPAMGETAAENRHVLRDAHRLDGVARRTAGALPEPRTRVAGRRLVRRRSARRPLPDPAGGRADAATATLRRRGSVSRRDARRAQRRLAASTAGRPMAARRPTASVMRRSPSSRRAG